MRLASSPIPDTEVDTQMKIENAEALIELAVKYGEDNEQVGNFWAGFDGFCDRRGVTDRATKNILFTMLVGMRSVVVAKEAEDYAATQY